MHDAPPRAAAEVSKWSRWCWVSPEGRGRDGPCGPSRADEASRPLGSSRALKFCLEGLLYIAWRCQSTAHAHSKSRAGTLCTMEPHNSRRNVSIPVQRTQPNQWLKLCEQTAHMTEAGPRASGQCDSVTQRAGQRPGGRQVASHPYANAPRAYHQNTNTSKPCEQRAHMLQRHYITAWVRKNSSQHDDKAPSAPCVASAARSAGTAGSRAARFPGKAARARQQTAASRATSTSR